jgi:uncharacterized protein (TIGR02466 family)
MDYQIGGDVIPLFSSPLYSANLENQISSIEILKTFNEITSDQFEWLENYDNSLSKTHAWLETQKNSQLYNIIDLHIKNYFYEVLQSSPDVEIYITESWVNRTFPGQKHHRHKHPNSIISGTYYFDTDENTGSLVFIDSKYKCLEWSQLNSNIWNSRQWMLQPRAHTLLLWPSELEHMVTENTSSKTRYSLSWNTFIKGNISDNYLARLKI